MKNKLGLLFAFTLINIFTTVAMADVDQVQAQTDAARVANQVAATLRTVGNGDDLHTINVSIRAPFEISNEESIADYAVEKIEVSRLPANE